MNRNLIVFELLEKLRRETRRERPVLELPVPTMPYWHESDRIEEPEDAESPRGVVIIDMNDYSELDS